MASRLSDDEIRAVYDGGQQGLAIEAPNGRAAPGGGLTHAFEIVDLDRLADREDAEAAVQAVPAQVVYRSLVAKGLSDSLEVLPLLSDEQVVRIFDYDVWRDDRLAPVEVAKWLSIWREIGKEELYRRFRSLDEEYQIAFLSGRVEMFDEEEYERLSQADQDSLTRLPCNTLFYRLTTEDPRIEEGVEALIEAALAGDVAYAYSLLNHAAYMPPNESEDGLARFRRARLEEDGFVSYEESLQAFRPVDLDELTRKWCGSAQAASLEPGPLAPRAGAEGRSLLAVALEAAAAGMAAEDYEVLMRSFAHLSNALCAASKVTTEDLAGQRRVLTMAQGLANLGLELVSGRDLDRAVGVVRGEHPQVLFRAGLTAVRRLGEALMRRFASAKLPKADELKRLFELGRHGLLLHAVDLALLPVLGFERAEVLKGLFNRFPVVPKGAHTIGSDVSSDEAAHRIIFAPVDSLARLAELAVRCDEIAAVVALAELASPAGISPNRDVDKLLATAVARALAGGALTSEPLTAAELARLEGLDQLACQAVSADLCAQVEERLRAAPGWAASPAAGMSLARQPIQVAMGVFSDIVMAVLAARERARQGADPAAWHGVIAAEGTSHA
jgi:hypothetical protein